MPSRSYSIATGKPKAFLPASPTTRLKALQTSSRSTQVTLAPCVRAARLYLEQIGHGVLWLAPCPLLTMSDQQQQASWLRFSLLTQAALLSLPTTETTNRSVLGVVVATAAGQ
jgi:hypothetical protein